MQQAIWYICDPLVAKLRSGIPYRRRTTLMLKEHPPLRDLEDWRDMDDLARNKNSFARTAVLHIQVIVT